MGILLPSILKYSLPILSTEPIGFAYRHFHAVMSGIIEDAGHNTGGETPGKADSKCWSAYGEPDAPKANQEGLYRYWVTVSVINAAESEAEVDKINAKLTKLKAGTTRKVGDHSFIVEEPVVLKTVVLASELYALPALKSISFRFLTPAINTKGNLREPLVRLDKMLVSLSSKWNIYFGKDHPIDLDLADLNRSSALLHIEGVTEHIIEKNIPHPGFKGDLTYGFFSGSDGGAHQTGESVGRTAHQLLRFGELMGVGAKTAWGFGRMRITETKLWKG